MTSFAIQFAPRESAAPDSVDRDAEADIGIVVDGICLTELEDRIARTVRPTLRASSYRLALWLAENWWRLRWEPESTQLDWQLSHNLAAAGAGYLWPAITFTSDGERMTLRMRPSALTPTEDIRYLRSHDLQIPVESFVAGTDGFIDGVIDRMRSTGHGQTALESLWGEIQAERHDPDTAQWRKLEALAGLDAGAEEGRFLDALLAQQASLGRSALEELIAASKVATEDTLTSLAAMRQQGASRLAMPDIEPLRQQLQGQQDGKGAGNAAAGHQAPPWRRAYQAADAARHYWGLESGAITSKRLAEILGTAEKTLLDASGATHSPISAGFRENGPNGFSVALSAPAPAGRRFALARLLGDYLTTTDAERLLPATAAKTARQKFQRAFAQQLLCPVEDLKTFLDSEHPSDDQIEEAATEFDVSPLLIKTTLVNQGLMERDALSPF